MMKQLKSDADHDTLFSLPTRWVKGALLSVLLNPMIRFR
jgi:hypothetical protein